MFLLIYIQQYSFEFMIESFIYIIHVFAYIYIYTFGQQLVQFMDYFAAKFAH